METVKLFSVLALFIATSLAEFHMSLEPAQREISLQIGETFQFICEAFDCPNPTFNWANLMDKTLSGSVSTEGSRSILTMQVSHESEGSYRCKVFCNQMKAEKSFTINVYSFPSDPVLHISSLVAGVQSNITCTVPLVYPSEMLSLRLLKDKETVAEYDTSVEIYQDGEFKLRDVSLSYAWIPHIEDEGSVFKCEAEMLFMDEETKPITKDTKVILSIVCPPSTPSITVLPSKSVKAGENITLGCLAESHPQATVWWVKESGNVTNELPSENGYLGLTGVQPQDSGKYTCYVENEAGKSFSSVLITVQVPPKNTRLTITPSELVRQGDRVIIQCMSEAFPAPTLILKRKTERGQVELETTSGEYIITSVTVKHSGTYTCESVNPVGNEVAELHVTVQVPPQNTTVLVKPSKNVTEGDTVTITCETHSTTHPTILLKKVCAGNSTVQQAENGTFTLHNVTRNDTGTYMVSIINEAGNTTEVIEINVQARYQSPQSSFAIPIIATSLCAVSAAVIGLIVYHMKQARLQGSYSLVKALKSRV
ncbi:hypothetical protein XENTR_v10012263 [Xenopus tropicalis]|uniref:Vascular cell adhesion molecule 1 n=1 Tax=Xenopus tropicalis TaxID=8364 RepID=A0A803J2D0_XENTR|nr:hypothetical protein XENTR_v10012263 [Xenopus tropicalis]